MPNDGIVAPDQAKKDEDEFSAAFDEIVGADEDKSDDDIQKELDTKSTDKDGESKRDQSDKDDDKPSTDDTDMFTNDDDTTPKKKDSGDDDDDEDDSDDVDWKAKALELEEKLKKEKQKTSSWDGRIRSANKRAESAEARVAELEAKLESQPSEEDLDDQAKLDKFADDFPELKEAFDVIGKRIDALKGKAKAPAKRDVDDEYTADDDSGDVDTSTKKAAETTNHIQTIRAAHPELDEIVKSGILLTWINKQKPFMKPHLENIYYKGNAQQVVDMITQFKESTGWKSQIASEDKSKREKQSKLDAMREVNSESGGAPAEGPDMSDYDGAAKEAGL